MGEIENSQICTAVLVDHCTREAGFQHGRSKCPTPLPRQLEILVVMWNSISQSLALDHENKCYSDCKTGSDFLSSCVLHRQVTGTMIQRSKITFRPGFTFSPECHLKGTRSSI